MRREVPVLALVPLVDGVVADHEDGRGGRAEVGREPVELRLGEGAPATRPHRVLRVQQHQVDTVVVDRFVLGPPPEEPRHRPDVQVDHVVVAVQGQNRHAGRPERPDHVGDVAGVLGRADVVDAIPEVDDHLRPEPPAHLVDELVEERRAT